MKVIDKFLKWLKTDRNTFFTYVLSLLTIFILVDRLVEFILIFVIHGQKENIERRD